MKLREEFIKFVRVPKNIVFLLLGPLFFTLFFGFVYFNDYVNDIPVAVLDMDHSSTSRMITRYIEENDRYVVTATPASEAELKQLIMDREVHMGLFIPPGYDADIKGGRKTAALLLVDESNIAIGNNALSAASEILSTMNGGVAIKMLEAKGASVEAANRYAKLFQFPSRVMYDPKMSYKYYIMPGFVIVLVQQLFLTVFVPNVIADRSNLLAKSTVHIAFGILSYGICLLALNRVVGVQYAGNPLAAIAVFGIYLYCMLGCCLSIAAIYRSRQKAVQFCMMLSMPTFLLAGYIWPPYLIPQGLLWILKSIWPLIYIIGPVRDILIKGAAPVVLAGNLIQMLIFGAIWWCIGRALLKWRLPGDSGSEQTEELEPLEPKTT